MKSRLSMITRQVREVKNIEDEIRQMKRKLENFDRYASSGTINAGSSGLKYCQKKMKVLALWPQRTEIYLIIINFRDIHLKILPNNRFISY